MMQSQLDLIISQFADII